jgi:hypothetical protein
MAGKLTWNGDRFLAEVTQENIKAMNKAAITVQATAKMLIGGAGSGRLYKRGSKSHRASSPGDPPARDTGILANSISFEVAQRGNEIKGYVGPDIDKIRSQSPRTDPDYGWFLDQGKGLEARPWLRPSLIKSRSRIKKFFEVANK